MTISVGKAMTICYVGDTWKRRRLILILSLVVKSDTFLLSWRSSSKLTDKLVCNKQRLVKNWSKDCGWNSFDSELTRLGYNKGPNWTCVSESYLDVGFVNILFEISWEERFEFDLLVKKKSEALCIFWNTSEMFEELKTYRKLTDFFGVNFFQQKHYVYTMFKMLIF